MKDNGVVSPATLKLSHEWKPNRNDLISLSPLSNSRVLPIHRFRERCLNSIGCIHIELRISAEAAIDAFRKLRDALEGLSNE